MKFSKILIFLSGLALVSAGAARAELVKNGGFESTAIDGSWQQLGAVDGWKSSAGGGNAFEIQKGALQGGSAGFNPYAYEGKQYLELNANALTSVSQSLATAGAARYTLSFAYSGRPDTARGAVSLMNVYWGDTKLNSSVLIGQTDGSWSTFTMNDLLATNAGTVLRFESLGPSASPTYGSYLDAVSVKAAVPEPATLALMLLGIAGIGMSRRRNAA